MEFYSGQNVNGWMCSEKLDGVFARLSNGVLFNREWRVLVCPEHVITGAEDGDGEIWHPEGLQRVQACLNWAADDARWWGVHFIPHAGIPQTQVENAEQAEQMMERIVARGGEGVVLRDPATGAMFKMKPAKDDEADVIGYTPGSGRNRGIGSLLLAYRGKRFGLSVGLSARDRINPPAIGERITFSFGGFTKAGIPRNARFMRVRLVP